MSAGLKQAAWLAAFFAAYVLLDWASYVHPVAALGITPWNPPAGLGLFLLLRGGRRLWPTLFLAALAADLIVRGAPTHAEARVAVAAMITAVYAGTAWLLTRWLHAQTALDSARDLAVFLLTVVAATLLLAGGYVGLYTAAGAVPAADFTTNALHFWVGDLNGILVLTPALLTLGGASATHGIAPRRDAPLLAAQAAAIILALWALFALAEGGELKYPFLLFLPLIWVAARWGLSGATLALAAIQVGLIVALQVSNALPATFVQLQLLMIALCMTGLVIGAVVTQRMVVEARLQEKQAALNHALQLAAAGEMTSALAHELNQPIAALGRYLGACEMLARAPGESALLAQTMRKAAAEAQRAGEVVRRLRDFYRSGTLRVASVAPLALVQSAVQTIQNRADRAGVRISVQVSGALPPVAVDALQMETVLQNLLNNAIDALTGADPAARRVEVSAVAAPRGVDITVRDTGPGLAPQVAERLFEPFTTTKADGMGMGLAISRTLVQASGGDIRLLGGGRGACFVVTLPAAAVAAT